MKHNHPRWGKGRGAIGIKRKEREDVKNKGRKRYLYVSKFFRR
jgi:hypothetical protein